MGATHTNLFKHAPADVLAPTVDTELIYSLWLTCIDIKPALIHTTWPQIVGLVLDAHMPNQIKQPSSIAFMFQKGLAPQQQASNLQLRVAPGIHAIINNLWCNVGSVKKNRLCSFAKLIDKGMVNPKSVRYISPQIMRCGQCQQSRAFVIEMLQRWLLGCYPHRQEVVEPTIRKRILRLDFDGLMHLIRQQPSKNLYCIVAECIAAVSVSDPQIHIVAAANKVHFAAYVEAVCSNAAEIAKVVLNSLRGIKVKRKRLNLKPVLFNSPITYDVAPSASPCIQYIESSDAVCQKQVMLANTVYASDKIHAFVCDTCHVVHGAVAPVTRGNRLKAGVSINLNNTADITCNACLSKVSMQSFVGKIAITKTSGSVGVCCMCANICGHITSVGPGVYCQTCATEVAAKQIQSVCSCGMAGKTYATSTFFARSANTYTVYTACVNHAHMVQTLQSACTRTPTVDECNLFFSTFARTC
jgi:hypothetical protein